MFRWLAMIILYIGMVIVIVSVFTIEAPDNKPTPAVSPAMKCILNLLPSFFFVYLGLWI